MVGFLIFCFCLLKFVNFGLLFMLCSRLESGSLFGVFILGIKVGVVLLFGIVVLLRLGRFGVDDVDGIVVDVFFGICRLLVSKFGFLSSSELRR